MKISDIALKRYTASKGKSLKWYERVTNPDTRESDKVKGDVRKALECVNNNIKKP